jgi:hypothetical protein
MSEFAIGDIVYDVNAKCLVKVLGIKYQNSVEVKTLNGQHIYFVYGTFILNLEDAKDKLQEDLKKTEELLLEIETCLI